MAVEGLGAVGVGDDDVAAVAAVPTAAAGSDHRAVCRGVDRCANVGSDVHRVPAVQTLGNVPAGDRPLIVVTKVGAVGIVERLIRRDGDLVRAAGAEPYALARNSAENGFLLLRLRGRHFAVGNDNAGADGERLSRVEAVVLGNIAAVRFERGGKRGKGFAAGDNMAYAGDRKNKECVARVDRAVLEVVGPHDRVGGHFVHFRDAGERVAVADGVGRDLGGGRPLLDVGRGAVRAGLRRERGVADDRDVAPALRRVRVDVGRRREQGKGLGVVGRRRGARGRSVRRGRRQERGDRVGQRKGPRLVEGGSEGKDDGQRQQPRTGNGAKTLGIMRPSRMLAIAASSLCGRKRTLWMM